MTPADLRAWRALQGLTQTEAAELLGVSVRNYRYWEAGEREGGRIVAIPKLAELAIAGLQTQTRRK